MNGTSMKNWNQILVALLLLAMVSGCANMTSRQKNTAIGAAAGGIAGSVLTHGSALGTIGGTAVGGFIGNQVQ